MPDTTNRAQCPVCYHAIRLTASGRLVNHDRRATMMSGPTHCPGSGHRPEVTR
jgi:hypothetical protein